MMQFARILFFPLHLVLFAVFSDLRSRRPAGSVVLASDANIRRGEKPRPIGFRSLRLVEHERPRSSVLPRVAVVLIFSRGVEELPARGRGQGIGARTLRTALEPEPGGQPSRLE